MIKREVNYVSTKNEQGIHSEQDPPIIKYVVIIGLFGGLLWSLVGFGFTFLNFMDVSPRFILTSWFDSKWINKVLGIFISVIIYCCLSVLFALLYYGVMRKIKSIFGGIIFGILLWLLLFGLISPMFSDLPSFVQMNFNTGFTSFCLLLLYGVFIGASVSYEYQELQLQKKRQQSQSNARF